MEADKGIEELGEKTRHMPIFFFPRRILQEMAWTRTGTSVVKGRRLTPSYPWHERCGYKISLTPGNSGVICVTELDM